MMDTIKILLGNRPRLLRESLIDLIQRQNDMEVIGQVLDPVELLVVAGESLADVVIVALGDSDDDLGICSHLLAEYPQILVLALSPEREHVLLYKQIICKEQIPVTSDEAILETIGRSRI